MKLGDNIKRRKCCYGGKERVNNTVLICFRNTGRDVDDATASGRLFHARAPATEKARLPIVERAVAGTISAQSPPNEAVSVTRPPPTGEGHRQGTVVQVNSDSGKPKLSAETWFVLGFATSEGRAAAASRGRISRICRSDAPQRSRHTEVCLYTCRKAGLRRTTVVQPWNDQWHDERLHGSTDAAYVSQNSKTAGNSSCNVSVHRQVWQVDRFCWCACICGWSRTTYVFCKCYEAYVVTMWTI